MAAVQSEYSLWSRDVEDTVLPTTRELGIGFVAYSPLGRGFLTGSVSGETLAENDLRRRHPRFAAENSERNAAIVEIVRSVAAKHGATPAQVALAWVFTRGKDIVPIPGTTKAARVEENAGALGLRLDEGDLRRLEAIADRVAGDRYNTDSMALIQR
jgi:aryl-alcohol dehydrogenase-like predicted oxidoreductase